MKIKEEWRPILGYEGLYEVSSIGRVKSLLRYARSKGRGRRLVRERMLKPMTNSDGYRQVGLCRNGKISMRKVSRLVAQ